MEITPESDSQALAQIAYILSNTDVLDGVFLFVIGCNLAVQEITQRDNRAASEVMKEYLVMAKDRAEKMSPKELEDFLNRTNPVTMN